MEVEDEKERDKTDWIYADRASGSCGNHCDSGGNAAACIITGKGKGKTGSMYE